MRRWKMQVVSWNEHMLKTISNMPQTIDSILIKVHGSIDINQNEEVKLLKKKAEVSFEDTLYGEEDGVDETLLTMVEVESEENALD